MMHNIELARTLNKDRYRRGHSHQVIAKAETHDIRRSVGRWLETVGRRLQGPARPSRSSA